MTTKPGMPFADSKIAVFLAKQIDSIAYRKTQREIANEIGYDKPNMISMFKRGETKVPLDKIPALAKAVETDAAFLFKLALEQYWPNQEEAINAVFGRVVTANEAAILDKIREVKGSSDIPMTRELETKIKEVFA